MKESEENRNYKDFKIQRLTRELVELRFEHAQCEKIASGVEEEYESATHLKAASLADSGHFEDLSYQTSQSKDSYAEKDAELLSYRGLTVEKNRHTITYSEKMDYLIKHHTDKVNVYKIVMPTNIVIFSINLDTGNKKTIHRST